MKKILQSLLLIPVYALACLLLMAAIHFMSWLIWVIGNAFE